jgi:hypothetical protein
MLAASSRKVRHFETYIEHVDLGFFMAVWIDHSSTNQRTIQQTSPFGRGVGARFPLSAFPLSLPLRGMPVFLQFDFKPRSKRDGDFFKRF